MRRIALSLLLAGSCADERPAQTAAPPQELVIPPIDSGAAPSETAAPATASPPPPAPSVPDELPPDLRDPRARTAPRARSVVSAEVQSLERALTNLPRASGARPLLLKRIAAGYAEIARGSSGPDLAQARRDEAARWTTLINDHPTFAGIDEARYYRGLAYELAGEPQKARASYYDLIKSSPQSRFVPYAYFAFGQMFFDDAKHDPTKHALAEQAFTEAIKYPAPANGVFALALLRLGETELALNQPAKAKAHFDRLRRDFPNSAATAHIPP